MDYQFTTFTDLETDDFFVDAHTESEAWAKAIIHLIGNESMSSLQNKVNLLTVAARVRSFKRNLGVDPRTIWGPNWEEALMDQHQVNKDEVLEEIARSEEEERQQEEMNNIELRKGVSKMPKISEVYESNYLTADDLKGHRVQVQIESADVVEVPSFKDKDDLVKKVELKFVGMKKSMLIGTKNAKKLAKELGDDTADWVDKVIDIWGELEDVAGTERNVLKVGVVKPTTEAGGDVKF